MRMIINNKVTKKLISASKNMGGGKLPEKLLT